jgi:hypothetical protein
MMLAYNDGNIIASVKQIFSQTRQFGKDSLLFLLLPEVLSTKMNKNKSWLTSWRGTPT